MRISSASDNRALPSRADSSEGQAASRLQARRAALLRLSAVVALVCTIAALWLAEHSYRTLIEIGTERQALRSVAAVIDTVSDNLARAESAQHSYVRTHDAQQLLIFERVSARMARSVQQLQNEMPPAIHDILSNEGFFEQVTGTLQTLNQALESPATALPGSGSDTHAPGHAEPNQLSEFMAQAERIKSLFEDRASTQQAEFDRVLNTSRLALLACVPAALLAFGLYLIQTARLNRASLREQQGLEQQVRERTQRLTELASHLQRAVENERARLARELHDELGALMTAAKLDVARLRSRRPVSAADTDARLVHLNDMLNQAIALKRRIIESLHPSSLKNLGLTAALEILTSEFRDTSGLQVDTELEAVALDADSELTVYRVVQEALTNVSKYARARRVRVQLRQLETGSTEVSVTDDGIGFDTTELPLTAHGLAGMRHRLDACGGRLIVESAPGRGTRIQGILPPDSTQS